MLISPSKAKLVKNPPWAFVMLFTYDTEQFNNAYDAIQLRFTETLVNQAAK